VGCHVRIAPRRDLTDGSREYETWINGLASAEDVSRNAFVECPVVHPTLFARRDRLAALGYRDRGWAEDYDLVLRMLIGGERIGVLPRRRLVWRDTPGRMWRTRGPYRRERLVACKAAFLAASFLATTPRYVLWGYGGTAR